MVSKPIYFYYLCSKIIFWLIKCAHYAVIFYSITNVLSSLINYISFDLFTVAKNDVFVTIGLGKEKYQTSTKEKILDAEFTEWHEVCEL